MDALTLTLAAAALLYAGHLWGARSLAGEREAARRAVLQERREKAALRQALDNAARVREHLESECDRLRWQAAAWEREAERSMQHYADAFYN